MIKSIRILLNSNLFFNKFYQYFYLKLLVNTSWSFSRHQPEDQEHRKYTFSTICTAVRSFIHICTFLNFFLIM